MSRSRTSPPPRSGLAPEYRALMATVRDDDRTLGECLGGEGLSWGLLLAVAAHEKAIPVLHRRVAALRRNGAGPAGPEEAIAALERQAWVEQFRLLELERRLRELLSEYRREGIEAVLLKGAALRFSVFDAAFERPMGDVDLLVEPERAEAARKVARALGWGRSRHAHPDCAYAGHHHLAPLADDAGLDLELEIHTELFRPGHPFPFSAGSLRREARPQKEASHALVPSPEHLLLHACVHYAWSHRLRFGTWKAFRDVETLRDRGGIDWDVFLRAAKEGRAEAAAFWTLGLARTWAGVPVDEAVLAALAPRRSRLLHGLLSRHFALELMPRPGGDAPRWLSEGLWTLAMRPRREGHGAARPWSLGSVADAAPPPRGSDARAGKEPPAPSPLRVARKGLRTGRHLADVLIGA